MAADRVRFRLELNPPKERKDVEKYCETVKGLLKYTNCIGLTSKTRANLSGFDRSLAFLLKLKELNQIHLNVLFHLTCFDLDSTVLDTKLLQLKSAQVERILVISGENYTSLPEKEREFRFKNSQELVEVIARKSSFLKLKSIAIAGYPSKDVKSIQEYQYLREKLSAGANKIYTQCLMNINQFRFFKASLEELLNGKVVNIVPSIGIFDGIINLKKVLRLTDLKGEDKLVEKVESLAPKEQKEFCKCYLINLVEELINLQTTKEINICTFGLFEFCEEILDYFAADRRINLKCNGNI